MRVGVVGGGVIGLSTAHYLKKLGADPVVVESWTLGGGCSQGNAGWVCPSISSPLPAPGLTLKSLSWMLRPDSPLYIKPTALLKLAPWLMRFRSFCNHADQKRGIAALAALNEFTMDRYDELEADGVEFEYTKAGVLMAFQRLGQGCGGSEGGQAGGRGRGGVMQRVGRSRTVRARADAAPGVQVRAPGERGRACAARDADGGVGGGAA